MHIIVISSIAFVALIASTSNNVSDNEEQHTPLSCELLPAMKNCCPVYCSNKSSQGALRATEYFMKCAQGFGCDSSNVSAPRCEVMKEGCR